VLLLVDLDGVVYRGRKPVPGVAGVLRERALRGDHIAYCTNNSYRHRSEYLAHLGELGAPVSLGAIFTSASVTAHVLAKGPWPVRRAMVLGGPGLAQELREAGIRTVPPTAQGLAAGPDAVVVGIDPRLTYRRLSIAARAIRGGCLFVATNRDPIYPTPDDFNPGAGAMVAALEVASRRAPDLEVGKPKTALFEAAAEAFGAAPAETVVVGDGLSTDIAAAAAFGARSVLMLTGVTSWGDLETVPPEHRPSAVVADAAGLQAALEALE
jgi:HAD superfamily hydrolase (TIGR01450 family)